ncbi:thioesterase II family protein [Streptomyces sp. NBC_01190]|uniref:thioesterase II family protein n=1 Tax=Streptomyces sp. NBC_01190 TaxID=2903767 RepID=UPI00386A97B4|nr:thioesterase domain-containing protein [Streptomyces sp. NBC_01190]
MTQSAERVTRAVHQPRAAVRLVCFAHSGAPSGAFYRWAYPLAPDIEVWNAILPGRVPQQGEPFATDWAALVAEFAEAISETVPRPYALLGQSLGSAVAFEVTRVLQARGKPPVHLFAAAGAAPDLRASPPVPAGDADLIDLVERYYDGIPAAVLAVPEIIEHFLPILRADLELAAGYRFRPGPPLRLPVTAFAGDRDVSVPPGTLSAWQRHTTDDCETHRLSGGHFSLADHLDAALSVIRRRLVGE